MKSPSELSFLPDDYLERKAQRRTNTIFAVLFLTEMLAIGGAFSFTEQSMASVEKQHTKLDADYADAAKRIEQVQQMQNKQRKMAEQAELSAALLEKVPRSFVLAEITNALPSGVSLTDFILESRARAPQTPVAQTAFERKQAAEAKKNEAPQAKVFDVTMRLTGLAETDVQVAQFISKLNRSKMLKDVNLIYTDVTPKSEKDAKDLRKFQIETTLDPAADVQAGTKNTTAAVELK
jgi:Tfp pilus assembly protein PilN